VLGKMDGPAQSAQRRSRTIDARHDAAFPAVVPR
jgi:hypothetical protein